MLLRIVDYVANPGGGVRFTVELLKALVDHYSGVKYELISHGNALQRYQALLSRTRNHVRLRDVKPASGRNTGFVHLLRIPGAPRLARRLNLASWHFEVPATVLQDCDVAWFPWINRHRIGDFSSERAVVSLHELAFFSDSLSNFYSHFIPDEKETIRSWITSPARIVISSRCTLTDIRSMFGASAERFDYVPLTAEHEGVESGGQVPREWRWVEQPYLLCPANISPHKNHEVLFQGVGAWGRKWPLVLTGDGSDLGLQSRHSLKRLAEKVGAIQMTRGTLLRGLGKAQGFEVGKSLFPLGYVTDDVCYGLLNRAAALVMPTLGEGGGSAPVHEALLCGVPVLCSDIPVLREQMDRVGGEVLWFDPHNPADLAAKLDELERNFSRYKTLAVEQISRLRRRSWRDVAIAYFEIMKEVQLGKSSHGCKAGCN